MTHQAQNPAKVPISITADMSRLSLKEEALLESLLHAARWLDDIYRRQSNQQASGTFDSSLPKNFYPLDATAAEIEAYLADHPEERAQIMSPFTVVQREAQGFKAVPYSQFYQTELEAIAQLLERASHLADDETFQTFLRARSRAFRTNEYRESDIAWIHTNNGPFELTIGPYESYEDTLFGVKQTFECLLGLVLPKETRMAAGFQEFVTRFDAALGERYGYVTQTTLTPMVVMDEVYTSGGARHHYAAMAYNLPNNLDIHAEVGSKKVFIRNVMRHKFELITVPIARCVLPQEEADSFDFDTYLKLVIGHESAHGLSFHFDGKRFGHTASAIEECKADVFGMWFLYFLSEQAFLAKDVAEKAVAEHLADCLRQIRLGPYEAHAIGAVIQLNWFIECGALSLTDEGVRFDVQQFFRTVTTLGDALYTLAAGEDMEALNQFAAEWGKSVPDQILRYLERFTEIPVDIEPIFAF